MARIYSRHQPDYLAGLTASEKQEKLAKMSYTDYLLKVAKVDPQCLWFVQHTGEGNFCIGADAIPALFAAQGFGSPGFSGLNLPPLPNGLLEDMPGGMHGRQNPGSGSIHFPDGNATIARLLIRWLIPDAVPGTTMESVGMAKINYPYLDRKDQTTRVRLNSTVVNVRRASEPYGKAERCCRQLRQDWQRQDFPGKGQGLRAGLLEHVHPDDGPRTSPSAKRSAEVWRQGTTGSHQRGHQEIGSRFPEIRNSGSDCSHHVLARRHSLPGGEFGRFAASANARRSDRDQPEQNPNCAGKARGRNSTNSGRLEVYTTTFESYERKIREMLVRTIGAGGFDPAQDIVGIMINRWPHGYAYTYNSLFEPMDWVYTQTDARPCVAARKPFGLISIASYDAAASPHTDAVMLVGPPGRSGSFGAQGLAIADL